MKDIEEVIREAKRKAQEKVRSKEEVLAKYSKPHDDYLVMLVSNGADEIPAQYAEKLQSIGFERNDAGKTYNWIINSNGKVNSNIPDVHLQWLGDIISEHSDFLAEMNDKYRVAYTYFSQTDEKGWYHDISLNRHKFLRDIGGEIFLFVDIDKEGV